MIKQFSFITLLCFLSFFSCNKNKNDKDSFSKFKYKMNNLMTEIKNSYSDYIKYKNLVNWEDEFNENEKTNGRIA